MARAFRLYTTASTSQVAYRRIQVPIFVWLAFGLILGIAAAVAILFM